MKLTRYGRKEWLSAAMIVCILQLIPIWLAFFHLIHWKVAICIIVFLWVIWAAVAAFFRDPERKIPQDADVLVSPADGVVRDIELIKNESVECEELRELFQGRDMLRIGIFLSVLNVHVNRTPVAMKAVFRSYKPGAFYDARDGRASRENEAMVFGGLAEYEGETYPLAIKQISGAIARRIVCPVEKDMVFERGQRYGMIKFGSRTELYLPAGMGFDVAVQVGQSVSGGSTVIARILPEAKEKLRQQNQEANDSLIG